LIVISLEGVQEIANSYVDQQQESNKMGDAICKGREKARKALG